MSDQGTSTANVPRRSQFSLHWQLLVAFGVAVLLVILKRPAMIDGLGSLGLQPGLIAVSTALVATCLLIRWIGTAAPALLFMSVFLVMAGYVPRGTATACLKSQLADPFVIIVFSGFAFITLMFGMPSERGTPPVWALRPGELAGRDGESLRSWIGRFCIRLLSDRRWARLGAMLPGFVITLISSGLGADAMARMAAIPRKSSEGAAGPAGQDDSSEGEQNARAAVFVLLACVLAPALIPVSLWGLFFSQTAGDLCPTAGVNGWLAVSYPALMALVLPFWFWWRSRNRPGSFLMYGLLYVVFWGVVCALALGIWWRFGLLDCPASEFKDRIARGKENLAQGLLALVVVYSAFRILRRCWQALRAPAFAGTIGSFSPLNQWASKVEWELIKGGFSRALGVVVIVVFAAIFREVIKGSAPAGPGQNWVAGFPFTALVVGIAVLFGIGISIGTAFGTFVLGVVLSRIAWPGEALGAGQAPILFGILVSISAAINQISPQADNVEVLTKYLDKQDLTARASSIVLPVLGISVTLSLAGWLHCYRDTLSWPDLSLGLACLVVSGATVVYWRRRSPADSPSAKKPSKRKLLWLGVLGQSAADLVAESRLAGEFIASYDADNDSSNVTPGSAVALLRTVPLAGDAAWELAEQHTKPDTLLLLIGQKTTAADVLGSPLVAQSLREGHPRVRVMQILPDDASEPLAVSGVLQRVGSGDIKVSRGREGLNALSREIVACLDHREGCSLKPDLFVWLFSANIPKAVRAETLQDPTLKTAHDTIIRLQPRVSTGKA